MKLLIMGIISALMLSCVTVYGHHSSYYRRPFFSFPVDIWRHGKWLHGTYAGKLGWWFIAGSTWYFYEKPIYPYPDPYVTPSYSIYVP